MHQPSQQRRASVFYAYEVHPYRQSADRDGRAKAPVVVVGAGPIGLLTAIGLAHFGVGSVLLEEDVQVSHGSRAIVLTRRSLEILQQIGVGGPFRAKGLPWSFGRSFYRGAEIYRMVMPHDEDDRFLPGLNIQQQYTEEYLIQACASNPLIDLRFGQKLIGLSQSTDAVTLRIDTPEGEHALAADWVVAADGGRSAVRRLLGLRMEGRAYAGNFVIADIRAKLDLPTERLYHFDPAWNPGNNVLVHRQPDDMWRIDFRLADGETSEEALEPACLRRRINAVLEMIGKTMPWELDWATVYSASALTLPEFVRGRIALVGDAAHLLPIFGVRGCNTGIQDCLNLVWKLAFVVRGWSGDELLASYSSECVDAAREICAEAGKSTRFMSLPSEGFRLMRDAVLSLSLSEEFVKDLLHWRTSRPHEYRCSALNSPEAELAGGVAIGQAARAARRGRLSIRSIRRAGGVLCAGVRRRGGPHAAARADSRRGGRAAIPRDPCRDRKSPRARTARPRRGGDRRRDGKCRAQYAAEPGTVYVLRPDRHVCAHWRRADAARVCRALRRAAGVPAL